MEVFLLILLAIKWVSGDSQIAGYPDKYCVGTDEWSGEYGEYKHGADIDGKPYYYQISCPSQDFTEWDGKYCFHETVLQLDPDTNRWIFDYQKETNGSVYTAYCLDNVYHSSPDLCTEWSANYDEAEYQIYPKIKSGPCPVAEDDDDDDSNKSKRYQVRNNDPWSYIQLKDNTAWIENAEHLIQCNLKDDNGRYIIMDSDVFDDDDMDIEDDGVFLMQSAVYNDINLVRGCKFHALRILNYPKPERNDDDHEIKLYVTTGVSMMHYIEEIDVDLEDIELEDIDDDDISFPRWDTHSTEKPRFMDSMQFFDSRGSETDYQMKCADSIENCQDFDENDNKILANYLQKNYRNHLYSLQENGELDHVLDTASTAFRYHDKDSTDDTRFDYYDMDGRDGRDVLDGRRRLGWGSFVSWVEGAVETVGEAIVDVVEKVVDVAVSIGGAIISFVKGEIDQTLSLGLDMELTKTYTFKSGYQRTIKDGKAEVDIKGELTVETGAKFILALFAKLKAKWTIIPPKFDHFRFSVGGHTEFLAWVTADISASAALRVELLHKEKTFTFMLGPIPILVTLEGDVNLELSTDELHAHFHQQFGYKPLGVEFGIEYIGGQWKPIKDINLKFDIIKDRAFEIGDTPANELQCPLEYAITATLIPVLKVKLMYLAYAGIETELALTNTFGVGASCADGKTPCDIIQSQGVTKLGLDAALSFEAIINLVLGAEIKIPGINFKLWSYDKTIELNRYSTDFGHECIESVAIDTLLRNICYCPSPPPSPILSPSQQSVLVPGSPTQTGCTQYCPSTQQTVTTTTVKCV